MGMKPTFDLVEKPDPEVFEGPCQNLLVAKVNGVFHVIAHILGATKGGKATFQHESWRPQRCFGCNRFMDEHTDLVPRIWGEDKKMDEYMRQLSRENDGRNAEAAKKAEESKEARVEA